MMLPIPPELWAAAPKDARWWAAAMPTGDVDYDACPGHAPNIWDADDQSQQQQTHCDGSCITDEPTDADEEPGMIR